mmetsp:Transcript_11618/g.25457  ORF Transcript_11618/g.25457 Transcript_11618/m.25457 type:complete len:202 (-) Transcript_11618:850-1455(-)
MCLPFPRSSHVQHALCSIVPPSSSEEEEVSDGNCSNRRAGDNYNNYKGHCHNDDEEDAGGATIATKLKNFPQHGLQTIDWEAKVRRKIRQTAVDCSQVGTFWKESSPIRWILLVLHVFRVFLRCTVCRPSHHMCRSCTTSCSPSSPPCLPPRMRTLPTAMVQARGATTNMGSCTPPCSPLSPPCPPPRMRTSPTAMVQTRG